MSNEEPPSDPHLEGPLEPASQGMRPSRQGIPDELLRTTAVSATPGAVKRRFDALNGGSGITFGSSTGVFFDTATSPVNGGQSVGIDGTYQKALRTLNANDLKTIEDYCTKQGDEENRDDAIMKILEAMRTGVPHHIDSLLEEMRTSR